MRTRSNSGVRLDYYQRVVHKLILDHQQPVTGLFPASPDNDHAWIRDNLYCILAVWGLSMAFKKIADQDEDRAKTYELEQSCVKLMRGLLMAMMQQKQKVEKFKSTQNPLDSLHAKYSSATGRTVVKDDEWGHLQIDAISLYLLILAQMTASGLQIVFVLDEVAFIQNLVFYIESAYCTPDYGIWERGDKTNHGLPELNASSIGMAKAALEAMNELDLFGARGGPSSVIHVLADEAQKCQAVLQSMLPRESNSKELDSGILSIISYPAFAVDDPQLIASTREAIIAKLQGKYGCKRFLRDGHKTPREDPNRLYYEPWELRMFEKIECEWPLFFCYLILDYCFQGDKKNVVDYMGRLEQIMLRKDDGIKLVPELYAVPADKADLEQQKPGSQERIPLGRCPFIWAQSLYILGKLLQEGFLAVGELDPLNRRLCSEKKPDVVVQIVILAEDADIRDKLLEHELHVQTIAEVAPVEVQPARVLSHLYTYLGRNKKLGLSGRKSRDVGILSTSKLYSLNDRIFAFTPQNFDYEEYYMSRDPALLASTFTANVAFLGMSWRHMLGRPTITLLATQYLLDHGKIPMALITTMKKLKSGYINGTRVTLGNLGDFLNTSAITDLSFLGSQEDGYPDKLNPQVQSYLEQHLLKSFSNKVSVLSHRGGAPARGLRRRMSVRGAIKKTRSINVDSETLGMEGEYVGPQLERKPSWLDAPRADPDDARKPINRGTSTTNLGVAPNPTIKVTEDSKDKSPTPPGEKGLINKNLPTVRTRTTSESQASLYAAQELDELLAMLRETESLDEQGDILQHLVDTHGLDLNTGMTENGKIVSVKDLLKALYEKACSQKLWGLVRHTAGMLGKRVEDLAKAVTDLLVRQKQITVGMPPNNEHTITAPLPENELRHLIHLAYGDDESTAMLTQELLVHLAMFIRTEPRLFLEMLRLRVGLIIQVMATELSRTLSCDGEEASEHLLNLSPFEMKNLLYHILSGKEFAINSANSLSVIKDRIDKSRGRGNFSIVSNKSNRYGKKSQIILDGQSLQGNIDDAPISEPDRQGQWLRRRRLDGALNRVPRDFYSRVWAVLESCQGLVIQGKILQPNLTQEMTSGELKFALAVETVLNSIPQPEYRQLVVEALMVLTLVVEHKVVNSLGGLMQVEELVHTANQIFLDDQMKCNGDATLCCAKPAPDTTTLLCGGAAGVCQHLYDSAPSGSYGTMTYLARATARLLQPDRPVECTVT
ncbi:probable phosphorylase b kinase regulatory subunit alpha isoform X2 [Plutella xylostella]|uniref:probable phosphorylase b kinase regulatory subunit alpha isoform X2 n=1 Tax=Plutella xylostella TaxID=51655 RepID=UPI0020321A5A|nr:probable phosphorylase b kinase regulatory subunit alpha isoform X2 [Plutella xylostella]XP_048480952.1 probable phosphorylase b kinase regulatory subunit alpha isoform X2 [Plutella xylostella]